MENFAFHVGAVVFVGVVIFVARWFFLEDSAMDKECPRCHSANNVLTPSIYNWNESICAPCADKEAGRSVVAH